MTFEHCFLQNLLSAIQIYTNALEVKLNAGETLSDDEAKMLTSLPNILMEARDYSIRKEIADGASSAAVGKRYNLTPARVSQILQKAATSVDFLNSHAFGPAV